MKIGIRADGGSSIGMGHIMRTLVLVKELAKFHKVFYICKIDNSDLNKYAGGIDKVRKEGFEVKLIEENNMIEGLKDINADILITDSYDVNEEYFNKTKSMFKKTGYIDDNNSLSYYNVDFLINQNLGAEAFKYKVNRDTQLLLGSKYILLREEFRNLLRDKRLNNKVENIMITIGGADPNNITENILKNVSNLKYNFHVIVGAAFNNLEELKELAAENDNINLYFNANMVEVMNKCDLAIAACGSTLYELCICEVPTIGIITAKNQENLAIKMGNLGVIKNLGWYDKLDNNLLHDSIQNISDNLIGRINMIEKSKCYIDEKGINRCVSVIKSLI